MKTLTTFGAFLVVLGVAMFLLSAPAEAQERPIGLPILVQKLNGSPTGGAQSIAVTTTSTRQATAFKGGSTILIANDGATKIYCNGTTSAGAVTTTTGVPIQPDTTFYITLRSGHTHIACITASGSSTALTFVME